ncbi:hypothetical protein [Streptomyces sp. NPDC056244]|uniref:hypothetical protein n=1 Tax=unclassified Streptomyces TaxID=2593676 RepID=UPI0035D758DA
MQIQFVGIDPSTDRNECPTVWVDKEEQRLLIQSYNADEASQAQCEATSPAYGPVPPTETIISIPARMVPAIRKAIDALENPGLR